MQAQALLRSELLDERTCEICLVELNGIMLPADDPRWQGELGQEAHPGCRYMLVPVFEGIDPVMDYTPDDQVPEIVRHLRQLLPAEQAAAAAHQLRLLEGEQAIRARPITLADMADIMTDQELLYWIFGEFGGV